MVRCGETFGEGERSSRAIFSPVSSIVSLDLETLDLARLEELLRCWLTGEPVCELPALRSPGVLEPDLDWRLASNDEPGAFGQRLCGAATESMSSLKLPELLLLDGGPGSIRPRPTALLFTTARGKL